jgi:hypothetical protein
MIDFEVVNVLQSMDTFKINDHDIFGWLWKMIALNISKNILTIRCMVIRSMCPQ